MRLRERRVGGGRVERWISNEHGSVTRDFYVGDSRSLVAEHLWEMRAGLRLIAQKQLQKEQLAVDNQKEAEEYEDGFYWVKGYRGDGWGWVVELIGWDLYWPGGNTTLRERDEYGIGELFGPIDPPWGKQ